MTERVILPRTATEEMWEAGESAVSESFSMKYGKRAAAREIYNAMLAASPNAGEVTEEEFEAAIIAMARVSGGEYYGTPNDEIWSAISEEARETFRDELRAALSSLGIKVGG